MYFGRSVRHNNLWNFKSSKFLCVKRIYLVFSSQTSLASITCFVTVCIRSSAYDKYIKLIIIFIQEGPSLSCWIDWLYNFKFVLHNVIYHQLVVWKSTLLLIYECYKIYLRFLMWFFAKRKFYCLKYILLIIWHHILLRISISFSSIKLIWFNVYVINLFKFVIWFEDINFITWSQDFLIAL